MFYPAHLNLQNRKCLVIGGGTVAERKVVSMLLCGGEVTLISPDATELLQSLAQIGQIQWHRRQFCPNDTAGMFLVSAATDLPEINSEVFKDAYEKNGIRLVNVVDVIPECTFAAASVVTFGNLAISISTSGKSPAMSRRIREHLEEKFVTESLYTLETVPIKNRGLPYPVYLLLENRRCVVVGTPGRLSGEMARRVELLESCGASIECLAPSEARPEHLSEAFLVLTEPESESSISAEIQLIEDLGNPDVSTFTTPSLIIDGDLIISISTQSENPDAKNEAERVHIKLTRQFENRGYGAFIDFLGELRPLVLKSIPTQKQRQVFFDTLIDQILGAENDTYRCCVGFTSYDCSLDCVFNRVRRGELEWARQYAQQRIQSY